MWRFLMYAFGIIVVEELSARGIPLTSPFKLHLDEIFLTFDFAAW